jgi:alpha-L-arabinofuranosidase
VRITPFLTFALAFTFSAFAQDAPEVTVTVHAGKHASYTIPRTIFGSFLEPIGNSTYNGLWGEILQNPSFEENLWSATAVARMIAEQPELKPASELALPLPWEPLDPEQGNRYEPRWGDAANSFRSLEILGLPDKQTGLKQKIYLPVHRELRYVGSLYAKHLSGRDSIDISLRERNHPEHVFTHVPVAANSADWGKYSFDLSLPRGATKPLEPVDLVIEVAGDERVLIDQVSLLPSDAMDGLDPDMVEMARAMKTPLVRFGGNFTSGYHWRDGIGPRDKRINMLNIAWGMPEYNQFGTDEFLRFCELIGAEPQIALNLGSGTAQEAADWVRYVNERWRQHGGLLWELGNELWGNWNLGYPTLEELPRRTLEFSQAIRRVDPHARLIATGQDPDNYQQWNAAQLTNPAGTFDFLSTHFVVTTDHSVKKKPTPDDLTAATFALPVELGRRLRAMQNQIDNVSNFRDRARIAFTEWLFIFPGENSSAAPRYDNMGGAIAAGGFFNMLLQNAAKVPVSDMTGIIEFAGIWKKRGRVFGTPAYYTFRLYSTADLSIPVALDNNSATYDVHEGITRLPEIESVPYLDIVAALNTNQDKLTLFCVNRHLTRDLSTEISLDDFRPADKGRVETLRADSIYDANDEIQPTHITPAQSSVQLHGSRLRWTFPHESVTRIEIPAALGPTTSPR